MKKIRKFLNGVRKEIKRVRWPKRKEMLKLSIATIFLVVSLGIFYYIVDVLIAIGMKLI